VAASLIIMMTTGIVTPLSQNIGVREEVGKVVRALWEISWAHL